MAFTTRRWHSWALTVLLAGGCSFPVRERVDLAVCDIASQPFDAQPLAATDQTAPKPAPVKGPELVPAGYQSANQGKGESGQPQSGRTLAESLKYPPDLPGSQVAPIDLPAHDPKNPAIRESAIDKLYPTMPELGPDPPAVPGPEGHPLALAELQRLAMSNSPLIRQASAAVEAARGAAIQARLYPNPNMGYEGDVMGTGGSAGLHGAWVDQLIKTAGKLKLAEAAAMVEVWNAQLTLRKTQADVAAQVRAGYFAMLVARRNLKISRALAQFTDELFRIQVEQVKGTQAAPYEPMQLRVLAMQARANLIQARNKYITTWKQLAAAMGLPAMPIAELAGEIDMPLPLFDYGKVLERVLSAHTDVLTAENSIRQARFNLRLAEVTPIPDVDIRMMIQKDNTTIPHEVVPSVVVGVPVPIWNRNQGNIQQAQANLMQAIEEPHRVRNDLTSRLAEAFQRYQNNRAILEIYQKQILPDQVRAYRGTYERHQQEPDKVGFADIVVAQQLLSSSITTYVATLDLLWASIVDVSHLLQTNDLFQAGQPTECIPSVAEMDRLLTLPCRHPCSPVHDPSLMGGNGAWPLIVPKLSESPSVPLPTPTKRMDSDAVDDKKNNSGSNGAKKNENVGPRNGSK